MADLSKDRSLVGNRKLEEQIGMLQKEPSQEMLAVVLTTVRRRMKEHGQMIVPVEADASGFLRVQIMQIEDGEKWLADQSVEQEFKAQQESDPDHSRGRMMASSNYCVLCIDAGMQCKKDE